MIKNVYDLFSHIWSVTKKLSDISQTSSLRSSPCLGMSSLLISSPCFSLSSFLRLSSKIVNFQRHQHQCVNHRLTDKHLALIRIVQLFSCGVTLYMVVSVCLSVCLSQILHMNIRYEYPRPQVFLSPG